MSTTMDRALPNGLPAPGQEPLTTPYWEGTRAGKLVVQRCRSGQPRHAAPNVATPVRLMVRRGRFDVGAVVA